MPVADASRRRDPAVTSRMMARVRSKNSRAELALRRELHARGIRYRLHARDVIGCPDLVHRRARLAVFVDGDFWHGNAHHLRGLPQLEDLFPTRTEWWVNKITATVRRDVHVTVALREQGWTVLRFSESDILRDPSQAADAVVTALQGGV